MLLARLDTRELLEDAPQNRSQNGWAFVELSPGMFSFYPYAHPHHNNLIWAVLCVHGLIQIPRSCVKMPHKTVHKIVELLWR